MLRYRRMVQLFFPLSPNVDIYNLWRKTRIKFIKAQYFNMLQIILFLKHTHNKYHKHKPDKYPMNMQQSFNYSIYSSATKLQKIITNSYKSVSYTHLTLPTNDEPCVDLGGRRIIEKKKKKKKNQNK